MKNKVAHWIQKVRISTNIYQWPRFDLRFIATGFVVPSLKYELLLVGRLRAELYHIIIGGSNYNLASVCV